MKKLHDGTLVPTDTLTKLVNGQRYLLTQGEINETQRLEALQIPKKKRREIINNIITLEGEITQRRLREAILGVDNNWLQKQDNLIQLERNKLK